ncbi:MAG: hypothetical protein IKA43_01535 [Clostridia bacterium]|nr:hypothetical protein [Clostridia bacterium]
MKKIRILTSLLLVFVLCLSFISCGNRVTKDDAKQTTEDFLSAIALGDYESAKTYLHPEKPLDIEKYITTKEERTGVDFQKGIEITRYTSTSSSVYDSEVDGSDYELEANIIVDGVALELDIEIVRNDLGYGIYSFEIDSND